MRILLAIDESPFSEAATQAVLRLLKPEQTEVEVLHVVAPIESYPAFSFAVHAHDVEAAQQALVSHGKALVERAGQLLGKQGFKVSTTAEEGDPRIAIVAFAEKRNCDLIVVGSHGRKGLDRLLMGSVAEYVARHARCAVQIVRVPGMKSAAT